MDLVSPKSIILLNMLIFKLCKLFDHNFGSWIMLIVTNLIFFNDWNQEKVQENRKKEARNKKKAQKQEESLGCENFTTKRGSLRKSHSAAKKFRSLQEPLWKSLFSLRKSISAAKPFRSRFALAAKIFAATKALLGTRVPFRNRVPPFRSCELAATFSTPEGPPFRSRSTILKGVSQLRNPSLAHERQFVEPYTCFVAAKWVTKSMPNFPSLRKCLAAAKSAPPHCEKNPSTAKRNSDLWCSF